MIVPFLWLLVAFVLLFLEFYLPGGIMAMISSVLFLIALVSAYQAFGLIGSIVFFILSLFGVIIVARYALVRLKRSKDTFFLQDSQEGYEGSEKRPEYIGKEGVTLSDLGPSGFAMIEGRRLQVVCQERYVDKGEQIVVVDSRGGYLIVSPKNSEK